MHDLDCGPPRYVPHAGDTDDAAGIARILKGLDTEPPPEAVKRKDGFDYLHGYYVLARANAIFGPLNVSYRHVRSAVLHTGSITVKSGERCYVVCEATAGVSIALPGERNFYTEGTATCDGIGRTYGDAFTIAQKGAFTDARKIAFRPLGRTFGAYFSMDDPSINTLDSQEPPEPKAAPHGPSTTGPSQPAPARKEPPLGDAGKWWSEIRQAQNELGWDRKRLGDYIKGLMPDKPANELNPAELAKVHEGLVSELSGRKGAAA